MVSFLKINGVCQFNKFCRRYIKRPLDQHVIKKVGFVLYPPLQQWFTYNVYRLRRSGDLTL